MALGEILGPDLLIVLAILAVLFGGAKLPGLARSLGQASREFKDGLAGEAQPASPASDPPPAPPD